MAAVSSTKVWAVSGQRLCTFRFKRFIEHWDGSTWSLEFLTFLTNHDCQLANLDLWAGEIALPRELGALDGPVLSDVSFEGQL